MSMSPVTFATLLRSALDAQSLTPYRLAQLTGLSQAALSRLLSGQRQPALDTAARIARALGVRLESLVPPC